MAVKRIQLRGISRTPSDRMNEDGGVAESLNTYIAEAESAPAIPPEDKANEFGLPVIDSVDATYRAVYVHRIVNVNHYIYVERTSGENPQEALFAYPGKQLIYQLEPGVEVLDKTVKSVGNTLVFSTTAGNGYAVYKNGLYHYLGSEIPVLRMEARPQYYRGSAAFSKSVEIMRKENENLPPLYACGNGAWNAEVAKDPADRSDDYKQIKKDIWDAYKSSNFTTSSYFRAPVFVRFAIRLYDNSYIHHTVPILMWSGKPGSYDVSLKYYRLGVIGTRLTHISSVEITGTADPYRIVVSLLNKWMFDTWRDVVKSIDMFITEPILRPLLDSEIKSYEERVIANSEGLYETSFLFKFMDDDTSFETQILDKTRLFFKVRSFPVEGLGELESGVEIKNSEELAKSEKLFTHDELPDDFRSNNVYYPERTYAVNGRILAQGITEVFGRGPEGLYGIMPVEEITSSSQTRNAEYSFVYEIQDNDETMKYVRSSTIFVSRPVSALDDTGTPKRYNTSAAQILFYPDTRCTAAFIIKTDGTSARVEMKPHPNLNCAYWIGDIEKPLDNLTFINQAIPVEDRTGNSYKDTYLFQTPVFNPFLYPVEGRHRMNASIVAVAAVTVPLSQGQFGYADLYIFTDDGIWVMKPSEDGTYISVDPNPVSRDVCVSANTIVSIDQAVVFITARGVMLLSGANITNLSPAMTGRHYSMESSAIELLTQKGPGQDYGFALEDNTPFMKYMNGNTQIAYDYTGSRLIFFNPAYNYEYIYMLQTNTWHKYVMDLQKGDRQAMDVKILNSFPDCYMFCRDVDHGLFMYNWSTVLDVLDETTRVTSLIATRPFDLGEPDVLKTINHLRIRGSFERYEADGKTPRVAYILLGSQDGIRFHRVGSLRGKSWKLFRIIILSNLTPTERISWIDIDYESRFTNRLR